MNTSSSRRPAARATSIGNRSSVARSAHCTSSNASISGALAARRPTTPSISSSSRAGSRSSAEIAGVLSSSSGTSRPTSARAEPSAASSSPAGSSAAKSRIISTTGANGIPPPSSSMQLPTRTRAPAWRASPTSSWTSRDLPTPASPPTTIVACSPASNRSRAWLRVCTSPCRPTKTGLTRLTATTS